MATKKERQRKLAKERHERRLQRQAVRAKRTRQWSVAAIVVVLVAAVGVGLAAALGGFSGSSAPAKAASTTTPSASATPTATPTPSPSNTAAMVDGKCVYTPSGTASRKVTVPPATPDLTARYTATVTTNRGTIVIDLFNKQAPCTVGSFVSLASQKYFNSTPCPRLDNSQGLYILQCGDPTGTGSGGPGYGFGNENLTGATYPAGTLAMANSGRPDSNGSQFFFVFRQTSLPPSYTPFGRVVSGLNILQSVGNRGFGPPVNPYGGGAPKESVQIESVSISKA